MLGKTSRGSFSRNLVKQRSRSPLAAGEDVLGVVAPGSLSFRVVLCLVVFCGPK